MPSGFGVALPEAQIGEFGTVSVRVAGREIRTIKDLHITQHFLTPTDPFRIVAAADISGKEARDIFRPGRRVEIRVDEAIQFQGFIYVFESNTDRSGGTTITIEGQDTMAPLVYSEINPDHHYPDKTPLETLLHDLCEPLGFKNFLISDDDNIDVAANRALKQKRGGTRKRHRRHKSAPKALKRYPLPKTKPEHNETVYRFLVRILNRLGLHLWPSVDGDTLIVGRPNYDQEPIGQLRRVFGASNNSIESGGIRIDATDQPLAIVMRGEVPPLAVEHSRTATVIGNPFTAGDIEHIVNVGNVVSRLLDLDSSKGPANESLTAAHESGTFNTFMENRFTRKEKWLTYIRPEPAQLINPFAPAEIARIRFLRDRNAHTQEALENSARKQMSLCARRAFVAHYTFEGFYLEGGIPQVNTIVNVIDDNSDFEGNLWVQSRTVTQSRHGGTHTELELLPLNAIFLG